MVKTESLTRGFASFWLVRGGKEIRLSQLGAVEVDTHARTNGLITDVASQLVRSMFLWQTRLEMREYSSPVVGAALKAANEAPEFMAIFAQISAGL